MNPEINTSDVVEIGKAQDVILGKDFTSGDDDNHLAGDVVDFDE